LIGKLRYAYQLVEILISDPCLTFVILQGSNESKSKPNLEQKPNAKDIREEKLAKLKQRLEADNDKDNFRLSTRERKSINQKIRDLLSVKIYAEYICHHCSISWTSVHGWTNFTQKCIHCMELAECLGEVELSQDEIQAKFVSETSVFLVLRRNIAGEKA